MKERPILFESEMVRAILDGRKTQTRRICKHQYWSYSELHDVNKEGMTQKVDRNVSCPHGRKGDRLWVKETWNTSNQWQGFKPTDIPVGAQIFYSADCDAAGRERCKPWRPSLFMMQWMSRAMLEIGSIRVERLNDISEADAKAEGIASWSKDGELWKYGLAERHVSGELDPVEPWSEMARTGRDAYRKLWESINGPGSWNANPWVWVEQFKRSEASK